MHKYASVTLLAFAVVLPAASRAVDLNGRWRFEAGGFPPATIVTITQTGSTLSITWFLPMTGTIGATDANGFTPYSVSITGPDYQAALGGRVMPSENMLDGRAVSVPPFPPSLSAVVATRCTCFDTNSIDGDGCSAACQVEPCWTCVDDPSVCTPTLDGGACDDLSPCTIGETCTAGVCGGGAPITPCVDMSGPWTRHHLVPGLGVENHTATIVSQRGTDLRIDSHVGSIDPSTGAFDIRIPNLNLFCAAFDPLIGSVAADGLTYSATGFTQQPIPSTPDHCDQFTVTESGDHCGDGAVDGLEQCDDGNLVAGDGCSALCQVEPCWMCSGDPSACVPVGGGSCDDGNGCTINDTCAADGSCAGTPDTGAACDDDNLCTMGDACAGDGSCTGAPVDCGQCHTCKVSLGCVVQSGACDDGDACTTGDSCAGDGTCSGTPLVCEPCFACGGALGCVLEPQAVCKASTAPEKSIVQFKNSADDSKDRFTWLWNKGAETMLNELGNPPQVTLCIYDESTATTALLFRATIPASASWAATTSGFLFKDANAGAEGVSTAQLRSGVTGKAKAKVKGKSTHLSDRPYPLPAPALPLPLRVQLQGENGLCLETRHDSSGVLRNDAGVFKAKGVP